MYTFKMIMVNGKLGSAFWNKILASNRLLTPFTPHVGASNWWPPESDISAAITQLNSTFCRGGTGLILAYMVRYTMTYACLRYESNLFCCAEGSPNRFHSRR
jgi:hypothetical protein